MKKIIRKIIPRYLWSILKQVKNFKILAVDYGQFQTIRKWSCLDKAGNPIPWYTYSAIEYLSHLDFSNFNVLEYGSGNSTLWWANRCCEMVSVEHDEEWFAKISSGNELKNVTYILEKNENAYIQQSYLQDADIVIIDGIHRSKCADYIIESLQNNQHDLTMIVFDNSDWYPKTMQKLNEKLGWVQADFHGFTPINGYTATTSVFINPAMVKKIKYTKPLMSICGIVQNSINNVEDNN